MRDRVPAQGLIEQVLLQQAAARPRTRLERLLGRDPLAAEARRWYTDAMGERTVAARLATLPAGWTVLHSLPVGRSGGDIDHLVVGPGGVFTVHATHHVDASMWVAGRTVLGARTAVVETAEAEARRVDRMIAGVLVDPPAVQPVVAIVGAKRLSVHGVPRGVRVLRAEHLRRFLRSRPQRLTPGEVARLVDLFDAPASWQPAQEAGPELLLAFGRLAGEVRAAARVRVGWAGALLATTAAASAAVVVPGLLQTLGGF
jgi:catechol 2,3-dioxygenase-like lactoylglutathione lyase family enzyme